MSYLTRLRQLEEERKAQQATGVAAREAYQQLQPSYEQAYKQAQELLPGVQSKYKTYQETYNQAVGAYNTRLTEAKKAYESVLQQGSGLESAYKQAQSGLSGYSSRLSQAESARNQAYNTYYNQYYTARNQAQSNYQNQLNAIKASQTSLEQSYQTKTNQASQALSQSRQAEKSIPSTEGRLGLYTGSNFSYNNNVYRLGVGNSIQRLDPTRFALTSIYGSEKSTLLQYAQNTTLKTAVEAAYDIYRSQPTSSNLSLYNQFKSTVDAQQKLLDQYKSAYHSGLTSYYNLSRQASTDLALSKQAASQYQTLLSNPVNAEQIGQQAAASQYQAYQNVVQNTYNPAVSQYNQYVNQTLNPAAKAYQNFLDSGALNQAYQSYANVSADKAQIDRAAQSARVAYESSLQEYQKLQAEYQGLEPQLTEYTTQMQTAAGRIKEIQGELPALQKSVAVEQDPQKRETRVGYGRSLLTGGTKRASSAR